MTKILLNYIKYLYKYFKFNHYKERSMGLLFNGKPVMLSAVPFIGPITFYKAYKERQVWIAAARKVKSKKGPWRFRFVSNHKILINILNLTPENKQLDS